MTNTSGEVRLEVEGKPENVTAFLEAVTNEAPPQSRIKNIMSNNIPLAGGYGFEIRPSIIEAGKYQLISPDLATCKDCRAEIFDPEDRRFRYPFTNCTNCGPRFTIIKDIPYDRELTTMDSFKMCSLCRREFENPLDRRFHAQPNACPICGPSLRLVDAGGSEIGTDDAITQAACLIKNGKILAIRGLGGFLLACDAGSQAAVEDLRRRKRRPAKPLAVMLPDMSAVKKICHINKEEISILQSAAAPIVLLRKKRGTEIAPSVAPGLKHLGVMMPYTPLHWLLMSEVQRPLVMTSGNLSEEPIISDNAEAMTRLGGIADYFLLHNRDIFSRYDDSVVMYEAGKPRFIRRARGYAPYPVRLPIKTSQILGVGAQEKSTFCLSRDDNAFVSQHIGDMDNADTVEHFEKTIALYRRLFRVNPELLACDLHPDYATTEWAERRAAEWAIPLVKVQHHHAHIASAMAENSLTEPVIGVAMDGTGYGTDGKIWGGEFLTADLAGFERLGHLEYLPLPGGDAAVRKPYRTAAGYIYRLLGDDGLTKWVECQSVDKGSEIEFIKKQVDTGLNAPETSSAGRLFDAVAGITGICREIQYDAQAAIELEMTAEGIQSNHSYSYDVDQKSGVSIIRLKRMIAGILDDLSRGVSVGRVAVGFHNTMVDIIFDMCQSLRSGKGLNTVVLSGGCFMNRRLLRLVVERLEKAKFQVHSHCSVPTNDGGISLGQVAVAAGKLNKNPVAGPGG